MKRVAIAVAIFMCSSPVTAQVQCNWGLMMQMTEQSSAYYIEYVNADDPIEKCSLIQDSVQILQQLLELETPCNPTSAIRMRGQLRRMMGEMAQACSG